MDALNTSREQINQIDREMAKLFAQRMTVCADIAAYKKEHALPIRDKAREDSVLSRHSDMIEDITQREYYTNFMQNIMELSCRYQARLNTGMKVVYSGGEGAFGYLASQKLFPDAAISPSPDFETAYRAVEAGEYDCAVLPIENSYAGDVGVVMDLMFSGSLYVNQILELDIEHHLLAQPGVSLEQIKTVYSHPQALEQCREFLEAHGICGIAYSNTALAAEHVMTQCDHTCAAIASVETADRLGMQILARSINTSRTNTTRFAVFTRAQHIPSPTKKNEDQHFILVFTTRNEAGALAQTLNIIGAHNFNMRNLKSRPMKELLWNYYFYVEAEGNIGTRDGQDMLCELGAVCARLKLVGAY